ncbi:SusC/RagA family TonB-linked outer membrane protein [Capnocytophaga canimorsus]|uniref:SusC/RagA family TonB-linked outer membrane protein n=1 Tax=Capnocytophaga canimorsus TaxID=28188 RepID=UPI0037D2D970
MRMKLTAIVILFFVALSFSFAQEKTIFGVIKDNSGIPLAGANVLVKGTTVGVEADFDGNYTIQAKEGAVLQFSFVGFVTKSVKVTGNSKSLKIDVVMQEDTQQLDDVVVVAYGTAKKQSLVGAQSTMTAKQLEVRPITNLTNALSGIAPGVQVTTSSGQPGSSSDIRIRGFGSINAGNDPIYVLDGSIYRGAISDIPSHDIESISVLKDAASSSLYGSSAGNGVVLITTKKGSSKAKNTPIVTYTNNIGFSKEGQEHYETVGAMDYYPLRWQQWFNEYKYSRRYTDEQAAAAANKDVLDAFRYQPYAGIKSYYQYDSTNDMWNLTTTPTSTDSYPALVLADGKLNPEITGLLWSDDLDWEKALYRTGIRSEHNLSVNYATDKLKSYMSVGYIDEQGYRIKSDYQRISGRLNLDYDVKKWLSVGTNLAYTNRKSNSPTATGGQLSNTFSFIRTIAPIYPIHRHNDDGSYVIDNKGNKVFDYSKDRPFRPNYNPILLSELDLLDSDNNSFVSRSYVEIKVIPELKFRASYSHDLLQYTTRKRYNNVLGDQPDGLFEIYNYKNSTTTFIQSLEYDKMFKKHHFNVLLGHESFDYKQYSNTSSKKGVVFPGVDELSNYKEPASLTSATNRYTKEGYFGRLNYNYSDLYNFSLSYRRDGTSRFHPDHRWGDFWSAGAGWHVKNQLLKEVKWIDRLKFRASIGQTGNDAVSSYYAYQTTYSIVRNGEDLGLRIGNYSNPNLVWEKQQSTDIAMEFGLFDRLDATLELFDKRSKDLIFSFPLPTSTGVGSIDKNIGQIRNYGIEADLTFHIFKNRNFRWNINVNGTVLKNKVLALPEHNRKEGIESGYHKYLEGSSIYDYYLRKWAGVNPDDGFAMYVIDAERYPDKADPNSPNFEGIDKTGERAKYTRNADIAKKEFAGSAIPDLYGGISTNLSWKGFGLNMHFSYQIGGKGFDGGYASLMGRSLSGGNALHVDMKKAWTKEGQVTDVPRLDSGHYGQFDSHSADRFLVSRTALMLKNVSLTYTLPSDLVKKLDVSNIRVGVSGENLFLWSKRKGFNPMSNYGGVTGLNSYNYAKVVTCSFLISL